MMTEMTPFEKTGYLTQVRCFRRLAEEVIKKYPIKVKSIDFIKYSANAIFKITDSRNKKYILRVNPTNSHTKNAILEEVKWLNYILKKTDILVPKPLYSNEGTYLVEHSLPGILDRSYCVLFEWIEGRFLWKGINKKYAYHVGSLIAKLQESGKQVKTKHRNYWNADGIAGTKKARFANVEQLTGVSTQQGIITAARRCAYKKLKHYENTHPEKLGLIHEDLNPNNIIINKGSYGVIDFDDCGVGLYGFDFTEPLIAFGHLTKNKKKREYDVLKEALLQGYSDGAPLTQEDIDMLPYFLLARRLCSIGSLELRKNNPKMRPWFLKGIEETITFFKSSRLG